MHQQRIAIGSRPKPERLLVVVYLLLASLTLAHAVYLSYGVYFAEIAASHGALSQQQYFGLHNTIALTADHPLFHGTDHAPNQYRIGVEYLARFIAARIGIAKLYIVFTVFDFLCAFTAGYLCYLSLVESSLFAALDDARRSTVIIALLAALIYPFAWVVPWQRPETLPSALYLVTASAILTRLRSSRFWWLALLVTTFWQSTVRTDVPAVLGISVLVLAFTSSAKQLFASRATCLAAGTLLLAIPLAAQAYLKLFLFPHATYPPDTPLIQIAANLHTRPLIAFVIAMLPWTAIMALAARLRQRFDAPLDGTDQLAIIASCLYLPLWWTVGVAGEVRLFVPFLLLLTPTMAKLALSFLTARSE